MATALAEAERESAGVAEVEGPAADEAAAAAEGRMMDGGRGAASLKTCLGSRNFGSMCLGAMKFWQTTKISAETFLACQPGPGLHALDSPGTGRLGCLNSLEQLLEHPHQGIIVLTSEHLSDKVTPLAQKLRRQLQTLKHEFVLRERILHPRGSDVRRSVVQDEIGLPVVQVRTEELATLGSGNVGDKGGYVLKGFDRVEIDSDDEGAFRHVLFGDLQPSSGRGTEIDTAFG